MKAKEQATKHRNLLGSGHRERVGGGGGVENKKAHIRATHTDAQFDRNVAVPASRRSTTTSPSNDLLFIQAAATCESMRAITVDRMINDAFFYYYYFHFRDVIRNQRNRA